MGSEILALCAATTFQGHLESRSAVPATHMHMLGAKARRAKAEARSSGALTFRLPFGRALHILAITVHHGPRVSDHSLLRRLGAADGLHPACALVLDLRQEGSHLALGRIDALIARLATTSL